MKVELNTDLIECIVPDTYGTNFCYEIKDDELIFYYAHK